MCAAEKSIAGIFQQETASEVVLHSRKVCYVCTEINNNQEASSKDI